MKRVKKEIQKIRTENNSKEKEYVLKKQSWQFVSSTMYTKHL